MSGQTVKARRMGGYLIDGQPSEPFVENIIDYRHSVVQANKRADAGDETLEICAFCSCEIDGAPQPHKPGCEGIGGGRVSVVAVLPHLVRTDQSAGPVEERGDETGPELEPDSAQAKPQTPAPPRSSTVNPYGLRKLRGYIWTREAAIAAAQAFAAEHDRPPQRSDFATVVPGVSPSLKSVVQLFGSFDALVTAAGFTPVRSTVSKPRTAVALPEREPMARETPAAATPAPVDSTPPVAVIHESRTRAGAQRASRSDSTTDADPLAAVRQATLDAVNALFDLLASVEAALGVPA